jgi:hypothetical protein
MTKTMEAFTFFHITDLFRNFEFWSFDIVSCFEIRISDLYQAE